MAKRVWETLGKAAIREGKNIVKGLAGKVKNDIDYKIFMYKKKISMWIWEIVFFVFGFVLLALGAIKYLGKFIPEEGVLILFGLILILAGWIFNKNSSEIKK